MKPLNTVAVGIAPSGIRRFFDVASRMADVISLGVGEPDHVTPWRVREAAIYALERGYTTYTSNSGLPQLRHAIAENLASRYGVSYDADDGVIVTVGVSEGLDLALRALVNPGDEVVIAEPSYVSYAPGIELAGGRPVSVPTSGHDGFRLSADAVQRVVGTRTKCILLCSPGNPTGCVQERSDLEEIVRLAVDNDLYIISDEIYDRLVYGCSHTCVASLPGAWERTVLLNGFSKAHAMTGWRIAYACAPVAIAEVMLKIHQYTMLCAPHIAQMAAIEALRNGERDVCEMVASYDRRRRYFVQRLDEIGLPCVEPRGAFYAFPSIRSTGLTSEEFAERLLFEERVAVVPGTAFGPSGEGHIRCSYATGMAMLEQALERISRFTARVHSEARDHVVVVQEVAR